MNSEELRVMGEMIEESVRRALRPPVYLVHTVDRSARRMMAEGIIRSRRDKDWQPAVKQQAEKPVATESGREGLSYEEEAAVTVWRRKSGDDT